MEYNNKKNEEYIYTIVDFPSDGIFYGRFKGNHPKIAANKAFKFLMKFINKESKEDDFIGKFLVFVIKNLNTNKEHKYIGNRIKLENPVKIIKNNKEIEYKYKNVIGKYNIELDKI
jgi:hypothetical protein